MQIKTLTSMLAVSMMLAIVLVSSVHAMNEYEGSSSGSSSKKKGKLEFPTLAELAKKSLAKVDSRVPWAQDTYAQTRQDWSDKAERNWQKEVARDKRADELASKNAPAGGNYEYVDGSDLRSEEIKDAIKGGMSKVKKVFTVAKKAGSSRYR